MRNLDTEYNHQKQLADVISQTSCHFHRTSLSVMCLLHWHLLAPDSAAHIRNHVICQSAIGLIDLPKSKLLRHYFL